MIPIGSTVRWAEALGVKSNWVGVVTGHPAPRMVECDGRGQISVGLLEVVGEMTAYTNEVHRERQLQDELTKQMVRNYELITERDGLADLVATQCEMIADMVPGEVYDERLTELARVIEAERVVKSANEDLQTKLDDLQEWAGNAADYLEGYLLATMGERRPVRAIEPRELADLARFLFEGVQ